MDANTLSELIHSDLEHFGTLHELLAEERQILGHRDFDAFRTLLEEKNALLRKLEAHHNQRTQVLTTLGLPPDGAGVEAFLDANADTSAQAEWRTLQSLIQQCREQNEINARITHRARATNRQLLDIIRGGDDVPALYNPRGEANGSAGGQSVEA